MFTIRNELRRDAAAREALLDAAFGEARFTKTAERLREGRLPAHGLSFVAVGTCSGKTDAGLRKENAADIGSTGAGVIGTVRLWNVSAGPDRPALLLGPLAVATAMRNRGIGAALITHALETARRLGHASVLLVGDAPYYGRFGFSRERTGCLWLPGPYERDRLLACELRPDGLASASGLITAAGRLMPPDLTAPASRIRRHDSVVAPRAA